MVTGTDQPLQRRELGRTGERVSCLGLGGYHIGKPKLSDNEATRLIRQAIDHGRRVSIYRSELTQAGLR